ncbi:MAG: response regulator [Oscillospiraceae bacterium]|nr:response regulator [Oscillospiraceae bacterium]
MKWFYNIKIRSKLFISFGINLAILAALEVLTFFNIIVITTGRPFVLAVVGGGMLFTVGFAILSARSIKSPILNLKKAIAEISGGNFSFPIRNYHRDEVGELADGVGDMVERIAEMNKTVMAMDYLETMICICDLNYNVIYTNREMRAVFGLDGGDINIGQVQPQGFCDKKCYELIRDFNKPCSNCPVNTVSDIDIENFSKGITLSGFDCILSPDKDKWLNGKTAIIRWLDGSLVIFHAITDITQTKQAIDKRAEYETRLEKEIKIAETASFYKTAFLAHMSQEIRTPMNSIIGFTELALDEDIPFKTREFLNKILDSSDWLLQIISDVIDISKIESGTVEIEQVPFDLRRVFSNCQMAMNPETADKDITFYCYAEPLVGKKLVGDPLKLRQAIINIISHAIRTTDFGIIKLLSYIKKNDANSADVHFEIKDSGIGLSKEQIKEVFEPTGKINPDTQEKEWTGLGLSIAKDIIELLGGTLTIESTVGAGSKFTFDLTFPTTEAPSDVHSEPMLPEPEIKKPLFSGDVLVCEDNLMNREVMLKQLAKLGLKTEAAYNGKEAVDLVQMRAETGERPFDLIFMDIYMPVMDGVQAAQAIFKMELGIPIVAMTINVTGKDRDRYLTNGMRECLAKPFTSQELWKCLLNYLEPVPQPDLSDVSRDADDYEELKVQLKTDFAKANTQTIREISQALATGRAKEAHMLVHTLKNNAALLEFPGLLKSAVRVEGLLRDGVNLTNERDLRLLEAELNSVLADLNYLLKDKSQKNKAAPKTMGVEETKILFDTLMPLLKSGDPECLNYITELEAVPGSEKIIEQMNEFEFENALKMLTSIQKGNF